MAFTTSFVHAEEWLVILVWRGLGVKIPGAVYLNNQNQLIAGETLFAGTACHQLTQSHREVIRAPCV